MKVLMTADAAGGVWTYALDLARAARDVEFVIATMGPSPSAEQRRHARMLPNVKLVTSTYKLEWMDEPWDEVARAGAWLLELESLEYPDVVHLNGYAHGALPFFAPKIVVGHSCVLSWWRAVKNEDAPSTWSRYRESVEHGLQHAQRVIAPTSWMLDELQRHYRFDTPRAVISNGRFASRPLLVPDEERTSVFAAGRYWDDAKNLRMVADLAPRFSWPAYVAGEGSAMGVLTESAMARAYARTGIYLHPALYEPFGLGILEAALAGCALVLSNIGSLRELWDDSALFVDPRDAEEIVAAVNGLIEDDARRNDLAARAKQRAASFTPARMAEEYRRMYRDVARREVVA